ncbi:MAG: hypothetical protein VX757_11340, partial [Planctomycetota bacterium]|nr:hypothetical protein [Planctomycetota bacterium]
MSYSNGAHRSNGPHKVDFRMQTGFTSICSLLLERVAKSPQTTSLIAFDREAWRSWTWSELQQLVVGAAANLRHAGVQPGDRVV